MCALGHTVCTRSEPSVKMTPLTWVLFAAAAGASMNATNSARPDSRTCLLKSKRVWHLSRRSRTMGRTSTIIPVGVLNKGKL